jgi:hypothetical protein
MAEKTFDKIIDRIIAKANGDITEDDNFKIVFTPEEKIRCLNEIIKKNKKILYVYEQSLIPESNYNYKIYVHGLVLFISTSNELFNGELVNLIVNLCSILQNDLEKAEIRKLVFENTNYATYLLEKVGEANGTDKHN